MANNYITEISVSEPFHEDNEELTLNVRGLASDIIVIEATSYTRTLSYELEKKGLDENEIGTSKDIVDSTKGAIAFLNALREIQSSTMAAFPVDLIESAVRQLSINLDT